MICSACPLLHFVDSFFLIVFLQFITHKLLSDVKNYCPWIPQPCKNLVQSQNYLSCNDFVGDFNSFVTTEVIDNYQQIFAWRSMAKSIQGPTGNSLLCTGSGLFGTDTNRQSSHDCYIQLDLRRATRDGLSISSSLPFNHLLLWN